jgi:hypothetical protein
MDKGKGTENPAVGGFRTRNSQAHIYAAVFRAHGDTEVRPRPDLPVVQLLTGEAYRQAKGGEGKRCQPQRRKKGPPKGSTGAPKKPGGAKSGRAGSVAAAVAAAR